MSASSIIPNSVNPDLQKERDGASFSSEEFASWWAGGVDKLKSLRDIKSYLYKDFNHDERALLPYLSHEDTCAYAVKCSIETAKKLIKLQEERNPGGNEYWPGLFGTATTLASMPAGNPFGVMFSMMVNALKSNCTPEQYEEFGKRAERFEVCGTYAQTELGHGTFLRGLETRADFDSKTDEFVLNSPNLTSYKWWPGGLGHSSNYCVLVAQLYIDNQCKGVHMFYVQLRDEKTYEPLPGVHIGEIGTKMGFIGVNNGFLGLKNVRIPRTRMLMRYAKVQPDGTYIKSPASVLTYFTMVYIRCGISIGNALTLALGATIATRYAAVRRQSPIDPKLPEPQIMDHVTQQLKLFPEIAASLAYTMASKNLWNLYNKTLLDINEGKFERLPELHSLSCSLKVLCSADSSAGIERLRLACGGHGYMTASNFTNLYVNATAACTYEGENTVLLLQVGRFLMKSWRAALAGTPLAPTVEYLADVLKNPNFGSWTGSWENIVKAMKYTAANKTRITFQNLTSRLNKGESQEVAANHSGIEYTQAAELHGRAFVFASFLEEVAGPKSKTRSPSLNRVLENLLELYLVNGILKNMSEILRFIPLTEADVNALQTRLETVLAKLRPDAVAIVDGFDFSDVELNSTLGAYDGNAYERIFNAAMSSPMNQKAVPKSFYEHLGPFLKSNL